MQEVWDYSDFLRKLKEKPRRPGSMWRSHISCKQPDSMCGSERKHGRGDPRELTRQEHGLQRASSSASLRGQAGLVACNQQDHVELPNSSGWRHIRVGPRCQARMSALSRQSCFGSAFLGPSSPLLKWNDLPVPLYLVLLFCRGLKLVVCLQSQVSSVSC